MSRRRARGVESALRQAGADLGSASKSLAAAGYIDEAVLLSVPGLLGWAEVRGPRLLSPVCRAYPQRWRERLGDVAPPVLWVRGEVPSGPWIGVVGGRSVPPSAERFAADCGEAVARLGTAMVSGGAVGCDSCAADGARAANGAFVRILPCALSEVPATDGCDLALAAPGEGFSTANAMERNVLIYASAEGTVVVQARLRQGGTWHGAVGALRRRLGVIMVRDLEDPAHRALVALGGRQLSSPGDIAEVLAAGPIQPSFLAGPAFAG